MYQRGEPDDDRIHDILVGEARMTASLLRKNARLVQDAESHPTTAGAGSARCSDVSLGQEAGWMPLLSADADNWDAAMDWNAPTTVGALRVILWAPESLEQLGIFFRPGLPNVPIETGCTQIRCSCDSRH